MNEIFTKKNLPYLLLIGAVALLIGIGGGFLGRGISSRQLQQASAGAQDAMITEAAAPQSVSPTASADTPQVARLIHCGDMMCEYPLQYAAYDSEEGSFDFAPCLRYMHEFLASGDLTAANFECVLSGIDEPTNLQNEHTYPLLLAPDAFLDMAAEAGFTLLTTANNHANDGGTKGMQRTLERLEAAGILHTGTRAKKSEAPYLVTEVNGIRFGIIAYTYESERDDGTKALNGNDVDKDSLALFNSFNEATPGDAFYDEVESRINAARKDGAEIIIFYPHWGVEFTNENSERQEQIAQRLCELGVDLIIGAHPHVVQNFAVLTSKKTGKQVPVAYSLGSIVTQIRTDEISAHCEDGVVLTTEFTKYPDGSIALTAYETQPIWVNKYTQNGKTFFQTVPVGDDIDYSTFESLDEAAAQASYERTAAIIDEGAAACKALCN